jgi:hypothetical protein
VQEVAVEQEVQMALGLVRLEEETVQGLESLLSAVTRLPHLPRQILVLAAALEETITMIELQTIQEALEVLA